MKNFICIFILLYSCLYIFPFPVGVIFPGAEFTGLIKQFWYFVASISDQDNLNRVKTPSEIEMTGDSFYHYFKCLILAVTASLGTLFITKFKLDKIKFFLFDYGHIWIRLYLGSLLIYYGLAKVFPAQFTELSILRLYQPVGEMSPMSLLWSFMTFSRPYYLTLGLIECLAGILIILPFSYPLGALFSLATMTNVFMLNLFFDVPVKLLSFHMVAMSLVFVTPFLPGMSNLLLSTNFKTSCKVLGASARKPFLVTLQAIALILVLFFQYHDVQEIISTKEKWKTECDFYGVWNIQKSENNWVRLIFHRKGQMSMFYKNGSVLRLKIKKIDRDFYKANDLVSKKSFGKWKISQSPNGALNVSGSIENNNFKLEANKVPQKAHPLLREKFKWIQEHALMR